MRRGHRSIASRNVAVEALTCATAALRPSASSMCMWMRAVRR